MMRLRKLVALALAGALILAACGNDDDDTEAQATEEATEAATEEAEATEEPTEEPTEEAPAFDAEAASTEVVDNLTALFDNLDIAGNPESDPADVETALAAAATFIEGGDSEEVQGQIPNIAALAAAAELSVVMVEDPTFDDDGTTATYLFSLLSFGNPSQVDNANGISVLEDGTWKISSDIWAAFVALGGDSTPEDIEDD